ncbi:MAG: 16S rRNA (cytosine(1402)-N(4))-methyltransferase RsmH [Verrucomicrobiia bacterium]
MRFSEENFVISHSNFAGITKALAKLQWHKADIILADLGVSSMQLDNPSRGFSVKLEGPLDMRMNPQKGQPASIFLEKITSDSLAILLTENADEPNAEILASALAGKTFFTTSTLVKAIHNILPRLESQEKDQTVRRVFQALRIAVNGEFSALEAFLTQLPFCLNPKGRVAILTFHSGEDRRVKKAFKEGLQQGIYREAAQDVIRPNTEECHSNPRATSAKLRWAILN